MSKIKLFFIIIISFIFWKGQSQSIVINEISQGPSGLKEYVEFLVTGPDLTFCDETPSCLDIRGWIFDDNNGYMNGASVSGVGIATGACRFSSDLFWSCIPSGTLITLYNDSDPNTSLTVQDISMNDGNCALVIPISSTLFEYHPTIPNTSIMNYSPTGWLNGGNWSGISMANSQDGFQIYDPLDLSSPVFSIGWGTNNTNVDVYMGPNSATDAVFFLTDCSYFSNTSWSIGCAGDPGCGTDEQTPGLINIGQESCISLMNANCNSIQLNSIITDERCLGECNGEISINVIGGITPYDISWNSSSNISPNTSNPTSLCAGEYIVTLINDNGNGCTFIDTMIVSDGFDLPIINAGSNQNICFGSSVVISGSGGISYTWDNGVSDGVPFTPPSGSTIFTVTGTDVNTCQNTDQLTINVNTTPTADAPSDVTACDSYTLPALTVGNYFANTGGVGPIAAGSAISASQTIFVYAETGTTPNCSDENSFDITINTTPTAPSAGTDATYCDGDLIADLFAAGSGGTLTWYDDAALTNVIGSGNSLTPNNSIGTSVYYVTETLNGCEGAASSVNITINAIPNISSESSNDVTACGVTDGTINISATGGSGSYSFSIDGGLTFSNTSGSFTGLDVNSYQVVIDDGNCQVTGSLLTISGPGIPAAPTAGTDATYCDGDPISDLTANADASGDNNNLTWYDDAGLTNVVQSGGSTYAPSNSVGSNTYYITETVAGCQSPSTQVTIIINPTPLAPALSGANTYCDGDPISDLQASAGGLNSGTFYWFDDAGLTNNVNTGPVYSPPSTIGNQTFYVVDSLNGCAGPDSTVTVVIVSQPFIATSADNSICNGDSVVIQIDSISGGSQLTWSNGDTTLTSSVNPSVTTNYIVVVDDGLGCSATDSTLVTVNPNDDATFTLSDFCEGDSNSASNIITVGGDFFFTPSVSDGAIMDSSTAEISNGVGGTAYSVMYLTSGVCADSSIQNVTVNIVPQIPNVGTDTAYCEGEIIIDMTAIGNGGAINWYDDSALTNLVGSGNSFSPTVNGVGSYTYYITESNGNCTSEMDSVKIDVNPNPVADFNPTPSSGVIPLDVVFNNNSTGNSISYIWDFGDNNISTDQNPNYIFNAIGTYTTTLTVTDINGCTDATSSDIITSGVSVFVVPNVFTPNGDGVNDQLNVIYENIESFEGYIANRWGEVIFEWTSLDGGWNGRTKSGLESPTGTYYYVIHAVGIDNVAYKINGHLQLMR